MNELENKVTELENRLSTIERFLHFSFQHTNTPLSTFQKPEVGQRQIPSDPNRYDVGMGPILGVNSEFV
jgi:hypothetical protein